MNRILSCIDGYLTGNAWEELCVQCYRQRYQHESYCAIPATHQGDAGIEGFTQNGIVHQCYCPEREYSDEDLYTHQRDKLTTDIEKLKKNSHRLKKLGVPPITEWHFNIPEYRDSRIVSHAYSKQQEVLCAKKKAPSAYEHIANNFKILIKIADDFTPEISRIIRTNLADMKLNLAIKHTGTWKDCDSLKVENIRRKIKAVMLIDNDSDDRLDSLVNIYVDCYISGLEIMNNLRISFPEIYEDVFSLEQSYKKDVSIKTLMNTDSKMNKTLFEDILDDFQKQLKFEFSSMFTIASIGELKQDLFASWLADCSIRFER